MSRESPESDQNRQSFRVALTADYYDEDGSPVCPDAGMAVLQPYEQIEPVAMREFRSQIEPDQLEGVQGAITLNAGVTAQTVADSENLLAIARFGVGYDDIDVPACTESGVVFFTAAGAVDRSMAEGTVGWMIALNHLMEAGVILILAVLSVKGMTTFMIQSLML